MRGIEVWPETHVLFLKEVYKLQMKSRANAIYYEMRLRTVMLISFWLSVVIALTASTSGLGTLLDADKSTVIAQSAWKVVAVTAAIAAVIRPIYAPAKRIQRFTRQIRGYQNNFNNLVKLIISIKMSGSVKEEHESRLITLVERHSQLEAGDDFGVNRRGLAKAQELASRELPDDALWWPPYPATFGEKQSRKECTESSIPVLLNLKSGPSNSDTR